jgi:MFS superfamily sulfate permease-like transporter/CRP-like cAMP-binding protein
LVQLSPVLKLLSRETGVGLTLGLSILSASLGAGVLVARPLGSDYFGFGAAAGVSGAIFGGACAALIATSSFILWTPQVTIGLVQAGLVAALMANPQFAQDPAAAVTALFVCVVLAGFLQVGLGAVGLADLVKYTPYPVVAGFMNGVSASIFLAQLSVFLPSHPWHMANGPLIVRPAMLLFVIASLSFVFWFESRTKKVPAALVGLLVGVFGYYALKFIAPELDLGPTLGRLQISFPPIAPVSNLALPGTRHLLLDAAPSIISFALAIVVVGTLQSLLTFRAVESLANIPIPPGRGLVALGFGNVTAAVTGGLAISVGAPMTAAAFRNGGRTRLVGITASLSLLLLVNLLPNVVGATPLAAIVTLLIAVSISGFDRWSARLAWDVLRGRKSDESRHVYYDLIVVLIVAGVTITVSIIPGIIAGIAAACVTFAINMSQPVVHRRLSGTNVRSKRVRNAADAALLEQSGDTWVVLQLNGVLFFGNAESLAREVGSRLKTANIILLDCRGVFDIDVSGAGIIRDVVQKCRRSGKLLLFCNLPEVRRKAIERIAAGGSTPTIFGDLDSALEWIEEKVLLEHDDVGRAARPLRLDEHDFTSGLDEHELGILSSVLVRREFPRGTTLATEGEPGNGMWLITKGCVDIKLRIDDPRGSRRIANLASGTTVGEMSMIENAVRSASIVAVDDVMCWELERKKYETVIAAYPHIGNKLLTNLIREMTRRIRNTSTQLRETES